MPCQVKSKLNFRPLRDTSSCVIVPSWNEVETVRLETVLKEIGRDPYLVMLDVQGMERNILNSNSTLDVLRTGRIKILAIGIHESGLEECRSF